MVQCRSKEQHNIFPQVCQGHAMVEQPLGSTADLLFQLHHHLEMFSGKNDLLPKTFSLTYTLAATVLGSVAAVGRM